MDENNLNFENGTADMQTPASAEALQPVEPVQSAEPVQPAEPAQSTEPVQSAEAAQPQYVQPQYTQPQYAQPQYAQPQYVQQNQAPVQEDAQQAPAQNPYAAQQAPAQNPYDAQQAQPQYVQYQQQAQDSYISGQPVQQQTPYSQPMDNPYVSSPLNGQEIPEIKVKKKHTGRKILIGFLIFLAVVGLGIGGMFIFAKDYTVNLWSRMTKSDAEYLSWLLDKNFERLPEGSLTESTQNTVGKDLSAVLTSLKDKLKSGIQFDVSVTGKLGSDITSMIGIPEIDKFTVGLTEAAKDNAYGVGLKFKYAGQDFITLNGAVDMTEKKIYVQIPEYDSRMVEITSLIGEDATEQIFNELDGVLGENGNLFGNLDELAEQFNLDGYNMYGMNGIAVYPNVKMPEITGKMINTWTQYCLDIIKELEDDVTGESGYELSLGDNKVTCTKMTLKLKGKELEKAVNLLFDKLKTDEEFYNLLNDVYKQTMNADTLPQEEYDKALKEMAEGLSEVDYSQIGITIDHYVDNKGVIFGVGIAFDISTLGKASLTYADFSEGENVNCAANIKVAGMNVCNISVKGTKKDGKQEGTVEVTVPVASMLGTGNGVKPSFTIDYYEDESVENNYEGRLTFKVNGVDELSEAYGITLSDYSLTLFVKDDGSSISVGASVDKGSENELYAEVAVAASENVTLPLGSRFGSSVVDTADAEALADFGNIEKITAFTEDITAKADATGLTPFVEMILDEADLDLQSVVEMITELATPHKQFLWSVNDIDPNKVYEYTFADLADYVSAPDYTNIPARAGEIKVSQDDIDEYIRYLSPEGEWKYVDVETIEEYDLVNISFVPSFMGFTISDYAYDSFDLIVGEEYITDGFDVQLIGKHVGDNFVVSAKTNEAYGDYAGYMVDFDVTVNSIQRYLFEAPELTDELAVSLGYESAQAVYDEAYQYYYDIAYENEEEIVMQQAMDYFRAYTSYNTEKSKALNDLVAIEMDYYKQYAEYNYSTLEDMFGYNEEQIEESLYDYYYENGDDTLIYANLIYRAGISLTGSELVTELQLLANSYDYYSVEEMIDDGYALPNIMDQIFLNKLYEILKKNVGL